MLDHALGMLVVQYGIACGGRIVLPENMVYPERRGDEEWNSWTEEWLKELGHLHLCRTHMNPVAWNLAIALTMLNTERVYNFFHSDIDKLLEGKGKPMRVIEQIARIFRAAKALDVVRGNCSIITSRRD